MIDFSTSRAESNDVFVLSYASIRSPPHRVSRPLHAGLQTTSEKTAPSQMLDLSRLLRNLAVFPFCPFTAAVDTHCVLRGQVSFTGMGGSVLLFTLSTSDVVPAQLVGNGYSAFSTMRKVAGA